jgi:hypothetical protein
MIYMTDQNVKTTKDQIRYAQLWAEIELPKLLRSIEEKEK